MILISHLSTLESSDLIRLAQIQPELEYLFRHALIQDAAYASLVKRDRMQLHRAVGEALEMLYPDRLASRELAPLLAQHFDEAGDASRALKYFILAGDAAARVYANAEAVNHYTRALDVIPVVVSADSEQFIHLYTERGRALELSGRYHEALTHYDDNVIT